MAAILEGVRLVHESPGQRSISELARRIGGGEAAWARYSSIS
jgi:hypothetical protein